MNKFSIIVPVYNIDKYIDDCISSILKQKYKDYELIIVDDGSTDLSGELCDNYKNIENVKVFHKENGGLSSARNFGISHANGKYLMFIDGDDFLYDNTCLKKISDAIDNTNADVIQYKMVYFYEKIKKYSFQSDFENLKGNIIEKLTQLNQQGRISISACDKVVKTSLIKNKILFEKGLLSEDIKWSYSLYLNIFSLETINENIYVYRQQRPNSISSMQGVPKKASDLYSTIKYWLNYDYKNSTQKDLYFNMISYWYIILRVKFSKKLYTDEMKKEIKKLDKLLIEYNDNYKVKKAYKLNKIIGYNATLLIMKIYNNLKNKGIIKL